MFIQSVFLGFSIALTLLFFLYGFNHYYLLNAARQYKPPGLSQSSPACVPRVAIHLPIYNEKYVIIRLLSACANMVANYGIERAKIVIIDDSNDETINVIDQVVAEYRAKNFEIEVLRRSSRQGFKAGALQAALDRTEAEFIAVFDADFAPPADFLVRTVPYFLENERLGIIQCRWSHINRDYNILTRAIATGIDVHFLIEQAGRYAVDCFQNFNGSGGILRTKSLVQAGGWQSDTLAEDLDASYRVQLLGYRILYLRDLQSPGEVPPTVPSYKKQQGRWACGSLRTAKKLLPELLFKREFGIKQRLEAFIHLTGYIVHPLMFTSFILACLATLLGVDVFRIGYILSNLRDSVSTGAIGAVTSLPPSYLIWSLFGLLILLCTVAAWIPPLVALKIQPHPDRRIFSSIVVLFFLGFGVSLSNTIEAGKALLTNKNWTFERTPKYAIQYGKEKWSDKRYQVSLDFVSLVELIFICLGGISIAYSIWRSNFGILIILIPYTAAYAFVFLLTILQSREEQDV
jgi:cellulose synthase/poly-beta-1,6-N-acetylglucosamine synthase-like glycosyltransferase